MNRKRRLPMVLAAVLALAVLALAWGLGIFSGGAAWEDMPLDQAASGMAFREGRLSFDAAQGDAYGALNDGPGLDLPAGAYRLRFTMEGDADGAVEITCSNGARIEPARIEFARAGMEPALWTGEARLTLAEDADDVQIRVLFEAGTALTVHDLDLYSGAFTDNAWTATFACLLLLALLAAWRCGLLTARRREALLAMGAAVLLASLPALQNDLCLGHDAVFHLARLRNLVSALEQGQFPARVGGFTYNGYGAATSAFYPDLFLGLPAALMLGGASIQYAMHVWMIAVNVLTFAGMAALAQRVLDDRRAGLCAGVLYTLAIYRLTDLYVRFAVGEVLGMAFLPLFLLGLWEVIAGERRRWPLLAVSAVCILESHVLTTVIAAGLAMLLCAVSLPRLVRERRLGALARAAGLAALLGASFLVPFFDLGRQGMTATAPTGNCQSQTLQPAQLLMGGFSTAAGAGAQLAQYGLRAEPLGIGLAMLLGVFLALHGCLAQPKGTPGPQRRAVLTACLLGAAAAAMSTALFPWKRLSALTDGASDVLQFPWRLLMVTDVFLALAGGYGFARLEKGDGARALAAALAVAALCAMPVLSQQTGKDERLAYGETVCAHIDFTDYTIPGSDCMATRDRSVLTQGDVQVGTADKRGTRFSCAVDAAGDAVLTLPLFGYDGYAAAVDGAPVETGLGENNRLTVCLPAGTQGTLRVWYAGKLLWRIADLVSLAALAATLTIAARTRRKRERQEGRKTEA